MVIQQATESTYLEYRSGSSNKFWSAEIVPNPNNGSGGSPKATLITTWGKIGTRGQQKVLATDYHMALAEYNKKVTEKLNKGYVEVISGVGIQRTTGSYVGTAVTTTGGTGGGGGGGVLVVNTAPPPVRPMLAEEISVNDIDLYIQSSLYWFEQKLDGHRILLAIKDGKATAYGRNGQSSQHQPKFDGVDFHGVPKQTVLDGELVDGVLHVFDLPSFSGEIQHRRRELELLFRNWNPDPERFKLVKVAKTTEEKRNLFDQCRDQNAEGIMIKTVIGRYTAGRSAAWLKAKFTLDIDVVVIAVNTKSKTNYTLGLYDDDGELVEVGRCSAIGKEACRRGDVIVVKFLYVGANGRLYQPRMMHKRDDKYEDECLYSQLDNARVNKEVVA